MWDPQTFWRNNWKGLQAFRKDFHLLRWLLLPVLQALFPVEVSWTRDTMDTCSLWVMFFLSDFIRLQRISVTTWTQILIILGAGGPIQSCVLTEVLEGLACIKVKRVMVVSSLKLMNHIEFPETLTLGLQIQMVAFNFCPCGLNKGKT